MLAAVAAFSQLHALLELRLEVPFDLLLDAVVDRRLRRRIEQLGCLLLGSPRMTVDGAHASAWPPWHTFPTANCAYRKLLLHGRDGRARFSSRCCTGLAEAHQAKKLCLLGGVAAKGSLRPVVPLVLLAGAQVHRWMLCNVNSRWRE